MNKPTGGGGGPAKRVKLAGGDREKLAKSKQSIDELFSKGLEKKKERASEEKETLLKEKAEAQTEAKKKHQHEAEEKSYSDPKVHRFDQESGLPVYKYFDLGMAISGSGFTADCPFDCSCCH